MTRTGGLRPHQDGLHERSPSASWLLPTNLKIYRRVAKVAKGRKVEWVIEKNLVLLRVP